jgi:hypothetical protein
MASQKTDKKKLMTTIREKDVGGGSEEETK